MRALCLLTLSSCLLTFKVPSGAQIRCAKDSDCPGGACSPIGTCVAALDATPFHLLSAQASNPAQVLVTFDKAVAVTDAVAGSFVLSPALTVLSVNLRDDGKSMLLDTDPQQAETQYTITASVRDAQGNALDGNSATFIGFGLGPDRSPPVLLTPRPGAVFDTATVTLTWSAPRLANSYTVELSYTSDFSQVFSTLTVTEAQATITPSDGRTIYWRVRADTTISATLNTSSFDVLRDAIYVWCPATELCNGNDANGAAKVETGSITHPYSRLSLALAGAEFHGIATIKVAARGNGFAYAEPLGFYGEGADLTIQGGYTSDFLQQDAAANPTIVQARVPLYIDGRQQSALVLDGIVFHNTAGDPFPIFVRGVGDNFTVKDCVFAPSGVQTGNTLFLLQNTAGSGPLFDHTRFELDGVSNLHGILALNDASARATALSVTTTPIAGFEAIALTASSLQCTQCDLGVSAASGNAVTILVLIDSAVSLRNSTLTLAADPGASNTTGIALSGTSALDCAQGNVALHGPANSATAIYTQAGTSASLRDTTVIVDGVPVVGSGVDANGQGNWSIIRSNITVNAVALAGAVRLSGTTGVLTDVMLNATDAATVYGLSVSNAPVAVSGASLSVAGTGYVNGIISSNGAPISLRGVNVGASGRTCLLLELHADFSSAVGLQLTASCDDTTGIKSYDGPFDIRDSTIICTGPTAGVGAIVGDNNAPGGSGTLTNVVISGGSVIVDSATLTLDNVTQTITCTPSVACRALNVDNAIVTGGNTTITFDSVLGGTVVNVGVSGAVSLDGAQIVAAASDPSSFLVALQSQGEVTLSNVAIAVTGPSTQGINVGAGALNVNRMSLDVQGSQFATAVTLQTTDTSRIENSVINAHGPLVCIGLYNDSTLTLLESTLLAPSGTVVQLAAQELIAVNNIFAEGNVGIFESSGVAQPATLIANVFLACGTPYGDYETGNISDSAGINGLNGAPIITAGCAGATSTCDHTRAQDNVVLAVDPLAFFADVPSGNYHLVSVTGPNDVRAIGYDILGGSCGSLETPVACGGDSDDLASAGVRTAPFSPGAYELD